ncbi:Cytochrome c oxidase assembly factor 4-like, mitochondrial [Hondaea fermentalgiana]|uniref:Cytochrome c oxidase assembly factor 4-like, mitochondrial n=1 Tax=Hondaea fermentalgiana TaxID=2315210 RepID=A0A2R5GRR5_9STRA|nr:Cytochrome c oxidase assembly factor 4-like, mitochondrial [Hondaea fermentalgiana]|eukprot:GBG32999.1 Cytochrome c oxidase assembly factor 4-like, mitochondrial [Hondaea fermentalgiana]
MDTDEQVERAGCAQQYEDLQLCMADNDRDWAKCQEKVKAWKDCFNGAKNSENSGPTKPASK